MNEKAIKATEELNELVDWVAHHKAEIWSVPPINVAEYKKRVDILNHKIETVREVMSDLSPE